MSPSRRSVSTSYCRTGAPRTRTGPLSAARCFLVAGACSLALGWSGAAAPAAEPHDLVTLPVPTVDGDHSGEAPPTAPIPPSTATSASPEALWANLMDQHLAYLRQLGPLSGLPVNPRVEVPWHVFAEGGFYVVHSYFGSNPAFRTSFGRAAVQETPFDYSVDFGPRVTLGLVDAGGLGMRAAWWRLEESSTIAPFPGAPTAAGPAVSSVGVPGLPGFTSPGRVAQQLNVFRDVLVFDNHVHVEVFDWEVFWNFRHEPWSFLTAVGVRYGYLSENYRAVRVNGGTARSGTTTFNLLEDSDIVAEGRNFAGVGPTGLLEVYRRLGVSGLSLYGSVRGSVLFGHQGAQAFQRTVEGLQTRAGSAPPRTSTTSAVFRAGRGADETVPMGDFEVGVNWTVDYGRVLLFLQAGLVDQTWFGAGSATGSGGNTGFYGLRLTAGFNY